MKTCCYRFETWQCCFSTSQSKNETNSCFACVSNLDMIPDGSFWHMGGSTHMGSSTVSLNFRASMSMNCKFCISCNFVCFDRPSQTGDCRRRRSWSRWTPERWHSWNFWCLRWDWDLRFLLLHFIRSHEPIFHAQIQSETPRHLKLLVWTYHFADYNFHPTVCRNEFWSEQPWSFHQLHLMSQDSELFWIKAPFRTMFAASVLLCSSMSIFFHLIFRSFFVCQMP